MRPRYDTIYNIIILYNVQRYLIQYMVMDTLFNTMILFIIQCYNKTYLQEYCYWCELSKCIIVKLQSTSLKFLCGFCISMWTPYIYVDSIYPLGQIQYELTWYMICWYTVYESISELFTPWFLKSDTYLCSFAFA